MSNELIVHFENGVWFWSTSPEVVDKIPNNPTTIKEAIEFAAEHLKRQIVPGSIIIVQNDEAWAALI